MDAPLSPSYPDWQSAITPVLTGGYRSRNSTDTDFYRIVYHHHEELLGVWELRGYQDRYGYFRPEIGRAFEKYLNCGVYEHGVARVRCSDCGYEFFLGFSCKCRCCCPSCSAKRGVIFGQHLHKQVLQPVVHRHIVFTIPKRIRPYFLRDRTLLSLLFTSAWKSLLSHSASGITPGAAMGLHTAGTTLSWHPHIHAIVSEGGWSDTGEFIQGEWNVEEILESFEEHLLSALAAVFPEIGEHYAHRDEWEHTGFQVWCGDSISADDDDTRCFMGRYLMRHPFALAQIEVTKKGTVKVVSQNEKVADWEGSPLDFLARVSVHIPRPRERLERYYGEYSSRSRGEKAKREALVEDVLELEGPLGEEEREQNPHSCRRWAQCIQLVLEVDPLVCPKCGGTMKIISFITDTTEIPAIMTSAGLPRFRAPPEVLSGQ